MGLRDLLDLLRKINTSEIPDVIEKYKLLAQLFPLDVTNYDEVRQALALFVDLLDEAADVTRTEVDDTLIDFIRVLLPKVLSLIDTVESIVLDIQTAFSIERQEQIGLTTEALMAPLEP